MSFEKLELCVELLRAIKEQGYETPTPVQEKAIPMVLQGNDVMVTAETGTGKTAAFTLPLLHHLHTRSNANQSGNKNMRRPIRALVLTPTRELAAQVADNVQSYAKFLPLRSTTVYGGVRIGPQIAKLQRGVDVLVATPGRLLDLIGQNACQLSSVEFFVLDEADRMLDMGFIHDIRRIMSLLPKKRQNLLFSATFSKGIRELADQFLNAPKLIEVGRQNRPAERITHVVYPVERQRKRELLSYIIGSKNWRQVLVFTKTKHGANRLAEQLDQDGLSSTAIHGNKTQGARNRALEEFKQGKVRVLVATDVAARGIDIDKLPHVVNFDLPFVPADYVHRVGRTGRASNDGVAVSLVSNDEINLLRNIERLLQCKVTREIIPGYEPRTQKHSRY